jgi:hypothetical protein
MNNIIGKFCLAWYVFLVHKIVLQFCVFYIILPHVLLVLFPHELLLGYVVQSCHEWNLFEVPAFSLGACDLTFSLGVHSTRWPPLGTAGANGRSKLHNMLSLVVCPKRVCFSFLTLQAKYRGPRRWASLTNGLITP